ncbi:hypothetical protein [Brevundimonas diminuta]|uniref:hypothetical protein n=1 Tax=Brevundimonas diminuta TaxID=293 RepID=UPI003D9AB3DC
MPKTVTIHSGQTFPTLTAAKSHFRQLLDDQPVKAPYEGQALADIEAVYLAYCAETNWPVPSPPASFYPTHGRGPGYTTRCYGVTFTDGRMDTFSMDKALIAISR